MTEDNGTPLETARRHQQIIRDTVDFFYGKMENGVKDKDVYITTIEIWPIRDKWEEFRAQALHSRRVITRSLLSAEDQYRKKMNQSVKSKNYPGAYEERRSLYEIDNISDYQLLRAYQKMDEELKQFIYYADKRIFWLDQKRNWALQEERDAKYISSEQHISRA